ncbi:MAG: potassium channel protein [Bryobacterales bacterium]|nr:potassium channel protein [Bryobacterales bacterium]
MPAILKRLGLVLIAVVIVCVVATAGYMVIEDYSLLDAVYMALTTMTTIGYGEIHPLSPAGRLFNIIVIVFGVSAMFLAIGAMTHTIIEVQFGNLVEKRRTRRMIDRLVNHYIICGYGRVGRGAAEEMKQSGVPFVIVDRSEEKTERAMHAGFLAVQADATRDETLRGVHIGRARGLIAALATDADNLFVVMSAKTLNNKIRVVARAGDDEAESKMFRVGADAVYAPYTVTGIRLAQALLRPHVFQFFDFATTSLQMDVRIEQLAIGSNSFLAGKSLSESRLRSEMKVVVLAIRKHDGTMLFNPSAEAKIEQGDHLIVMGESEPLRTLETRVAGDAA